MTEKQRELLAELASGFLDMLELVRLYDKRERVGGLAARDDDRRVVLEKALGTSEGVVRAIMRDGIE